MIGAAAKKWLRDAAELESDDKAVLVFCMDVWDNAQDDIFLIYEAQKYLEVLIKVVPHKYPRRGNAWKRVFKERVNELYRAFHGVLENRWLRMMRRG